MSAETASKKRGRPKKADKIVSSTGEQSQGVSVTTPRQINKTRSISTTKASSNEPIPKKPSRRRKLVGIDENENAIQEPVHQGVPPVPAKNGSSNTGEHSSNSTILSQATAFQDTKHHQEISIVDDGRSTSSIPPTLSSTIQSTRTITIPNSRPSTIRQSSSTSKSQSSISNPSKSSFLSGFLSDAPEAAPEAPESSKISDRSAFNANSISIDDIVSGAGVSDLTTLTAAIQAKSDTKRERQPAIPINTPKTFKSHNLNVFPDKPESTKAQVKPKTGPKYINPEGYKLSSFKGFKASSPTEPATSQTIQPRPPPITTTQSPSIPPTSSMSHSSPSPPTSTGPTQKATLKTSTTSPQSRPFTPQRTPTPSTPTTSTRTTPPTNPPRLPKTTTTTTTTTSTTTPLHPTTLRPKRPTEMSASELLANPAFRSLRLKWTGLIVGIPVLVVTSWLLWVRIDGGGESAVEERRRRGEMPRRVLDDGGLERG